MSGVFKPNSLKAKLKQYGLVDLYEIFHRQSITTTILWDLSEEEIREMNLNVGQRHRYMRAKHDWLSKSKAVNNVIYVIYNARFCKLIYALTKC